MVTDNETVYAKYEILDAKTGAKKRGKYFVLRVDAADPVERIAVADALIKYAKVQADAGRHNYAKAILDYVKASETVADIRTKCLAGKMTAKKLTAMGYTKVYGLKIPLELLTDAELEEGLRYCRSCAEEAAFFDNAGKSDRLYGSVAKIKAEIAKREGVRYGK